MRLTAARRVYVLMREEKKPEGHDTWADWWTERFGEGETFEMYIRERMNAKIQPLS